ncbi:hypothetical protein Ocin01_00762 [Orchesella cincta]|uniref:Uncharacterized protein n=1 Tax=Orchesella cincta TaxID=48709 RepID=A0A1D2NKX8_ORCCI|nr:hypothetical protein Ocin01_00762 [Orchesella cincta]
MDTRVRKSRKAGLSSCSTSDEEWTDKYEKEIDRQVDAIFQMAEQLNESNQEEFTNFQAFDDLELMANLNQGLRRKKRRNNLSSILLLTVVVVLLALFAERFLVSGIWIRESFCKAVMNEPLCHQCYGPWNIYKGWIYCLQF